jgi:ParB family chromosome partitioning protein
LPTGFDGCETFELIAGERRVRAMRDVLGWTEIPVMVCELDDAGARALMWAENDARSDLSLLDQARAVAARMVPGRDLAGVAADLGHNVRWAENRLALLRLDDTVAALVDCGQLRLERGVSIADLPHAAQRAAVSAAGDASADVWRSTVSALTAEADQAAMFDAGAFTLTTEEWDTKAARYVTNADREAVALERDTELYGPQELADLLGLSVAAVHQRKKRGKLPQPDLTVSAVPMWRRGTLRAAGMVPADV